MSLYFDEGHTPDPVGEFLTSLDRVEGLDARLALAGHGRPFTDVAATSPPTARSSPSGSTASLGARRGPGTAYELAQRVYGEAFSEETATGCWRRPAPG